MKRITYQPWLVALAVLFVLGCAKHEDLPQAFNVTTPPMATNMAVEYQGGLDYRITFDVSDRSIISSYRVYWIDLGSPDPAVEALDADVPSPPEILVQLPFAFAEPTFGLSTVTTENVEGAMTTATVPPATP